LLYLYLSKRIKSLLEIFRGCLCIPDIVWQDLDDLLPSEVELVLYERVDAHLAKVAEGQLVPGRQVILLGSPLSYRSEEVRPMASRVRKLPKQCCGAEIISFGSGSPEPQIRIAALAPTPSPGSNKFYKILDSCFFDRSTSTFLHGLMNVVPK
jgi:hypothetical protein